MIYNYQITLLTNVSKSEKSIYYFLFFYVIPFFSCGKEDTTIPRIIINKPLSNDSFQIPTNINIVGFDLGR